MPFTEDLDAFFDLAGFATTATLTVGGVPGTVNVIFDKSYLDPLGQFESAAPTAWLTTAAAGAVVQGDTLTVNAVAYTVVEVMPDGTGVTQIRLRAA